MRVRIPNRPDVAKGGRELPSGGLPKHVADVRLPGGTRLGALTHPEIARLCEVLQIPDTGHDRGKQHNASALVSTLEAIGRQASEKAIAAHLQSRLGGAS